MKIQAYSKGSYGSWEEAGVNGAIYERELPAAFNDMPWEKEEAVLSLCDLVVETILEGLGEEGCIEYRIV